jgi:hypothetical protein
MQPAMRIDHVVVDGSNIATEGRDAPSLAQLDDAVQAFIEEYHPTFVTVVVDATFPNRIDRKERDTYEDAVNANELITPPAGAIGRGDAFVLQIARRAGASILSNDSFQEFHGDHPWLFDRGRLIGGKPVPHVGWVFMERAPVRGPTSRRAVSEARKVAKVAEPVTKATADSVADAVGAATDAAEEAPKPARRSRAKATKAAKAAKAAPKVSADEATAPAAVADVVADSGLAAAAGLDAPDDDGRSAARKGVEPYNEALPFIEFVGRHAVGSEVDATVDQFSSHGAYVTVGEARAYVPLRNLADPAPRSAKEVLRPGETRRFVVVSVDPPRRGIDLALPGVVEVPAVGPVDLGPPGEDVEDTVAALPPEVPATATRGRRKAAGSASAAPAKRSRARKAAAPVAEAEAAPAKRSRARKAAEPATDGGPAPAKRSRARKAAAPVAEAEGPAPAKRSRARKAAEPATEEAPAPAKRSRARKAAAPTAEAESTPGEIDTPAPAKRSRARKAAAPVAEAEAAPVKRSRARKAPAAAGDGQAPAAKKAARRSSGRKAAAAVGVADGAGGGANGRGGGRGSGNGDGSP